ncbi:binding-protein-dependent transport systems inner membrane component [Deinococcus marmoris]|uniref:Binding-protein-dependent transport systems inner membrane component n=2 Tax=Deinococcus marmoris TaxID=249408 RepID=A0A1U7P000_9DEIO|nr:binding-protein-dependent transport systems inner membrane component [Deinococcus marmoris]
MTMPMLMLAPFMVLFAAFVLYPVVKSLYLSFTDFNAISPPKLNGISNYTELFSDPRFYKALGNTTIFVVAVVALNTAMGLLLAVAFGGQRAWDQFMRAVFFLPSVAGGIAILAVWKWILNSEGYGVLNAARHSFGLEPISWLGTPNLTLPVLIAVAVWGGMGGTMILFVAGLRSIPNDLYEAAAIDGATASTRFWKITLPLLRPTLLYVTITGTIGAFQVFNEPYVMFGTVSGPGGLLDSALTLVSYLYDRGFSHFQLGYASAVAWVLFIIVFILTLINLRIGDPDERKVD